MLETYHLKTYQFQCSRLGAVTPVNTHIAHYSDDGGNYPLDAEIPFASSEYRMWCPNAERCGVRRITGDGTVEAWHLCPALTTLRESKSLTGNATAIACSESLIQVH